MPQKSNNSFMPDMIEAPPPDIQDKTVDEIMEVEDEENITMEEVCDHNEE